MIRETASTFIDHDSDILNGAFGDSLLNKSKHKYVLDEIKKVTAEKIFASNLVVPVEIAGFQVISGLLSCFGKVINELRSQGFDAQKIDKLSRKLLQHSGLDFDARDNTYSALLKVTDYVSGMTDSYAVDQYQLLSGIRYR